jgi:hypothetical protein
MCVAWSDCLAMLRWIRAGDPEGLDCGSVAPSHEAAKVSICVDHSVFCFGTISGQSQLALPQSFEGNDFRPT